MESHDLVLGLFECATEESWAATLFAIAAKLGFKHVLYGVLPYKGCSMEKLFVKSNYPKTWRTTYDHRELHKVDPIVRHCLGSSLPLVWKPETFSQPKQKILYEEASSYGLRFGTSYPVHGSEGEFGILSLVTDEAIDTRSPLGRGTPHFASLAAIRDYVFESSRKFAQNRDGKLTPVSLTHRELECLSWVMVGKSSWEISCINTCSEATINFHISNIKTKFRVHTRQQAVVQAIKHGLLVAA